MRAPLLALVLVAGCRFDPAGLEGGAIDGGADPIDAARPLEIGLGDGSDGAGDVDADGPLDAYTHLTADADAGSTRLVVYDTTGFEADDVVLVHQVAGVDPATQTSGDQTPLDLRDDPSGAGNWELARVAAATGTRLDLTQPLSRAYRAQLSQVVRVPQYTDLRIRGAATVTAPAYAQSGGVIAILATGEIRIDGAIDATAVGFPGGAPAVDPVGTYGCTLRDGDEAAGGGAPKGTGLVV
ncbi:MAG: hypothetical protein KC464_15065, partial [Myxococcales bacterium]|nr:hypothetical protein [Myxococcales bacterium]